jgi:hypothetical protein
MNGRPVGSLADEAAALLEALQAALGGTGAAAGAAGGEAPAASAFPGSAGLEAALLGLRQALRRGEETLGAVGALSGEQAVAWCRTVAENLTDTLAADGTSEACGVCPVCTAIRWARTLRPEALRHLLDASVSLAEALRATVAPAQEPAAPPTPVQHIDIAMPGPDAPARGPAV